MTNPVTVDIKDVLVDNGNGVFAASSGWSIVIGKMVDSPDTIIALYDTGGFDQTPLFDNDPIQKPTLDIRVRALDYITAYEKALEIDNVLNLMNVTENDILSARSYVGVLRMSDIFFLAYDDNNRPMFGLNYRILRYK